MAFTEHPVFKKPDSHDQTIWRYMDFTKFVSMLENRALYFRNLEKLSKSDFFEGMLPNNFYEHRKWTSLNDVPLLERNRFSHSGPLLPADELAVIKSQREKHAKLVWSNRKSRYVNCWHISAHESSAMWSIYTSRGSGIAISSTYDRLDSALAPTSGNELFCGKIRYADYSDNADEKIPQNLFANAMRKRKSFEFEKELRVVFWDNNISHKALPNGVRFNRGPDEIENMEVSDGREISCDLNNLIQNVYVYPAAENWFRDLVAAVLRKYALDKGVQTSNLDVAPIR
jgi:hypothetical protein